MRSIKIRRDTVTICQDVSGKCRCWFVKRQNVVVFSVWYSCLYQVLCMLRWSRTCCCQYFRTKTVILCDTMSFTPCPTQPILLSAGPPTLQSLILRSSWRSSSSLQASSSFSRTDAESNTAGRWDRGANTSLHLILIQIIIFELLLGF